MEGARVYLACTLLLLAFSSIASAAIVEHTFNVQNLTVSRLCKQQLITVVNGSLPGPTVRVNEGDSLAIHVINNSPHNITIHWHGIFHRLTVWADGPSMITQCPIQPGQSYTYRFKITGQEGTLWWHAHASFLRATVYGALIIRPKSGHSYPFPKPHKEVPILFGEWWNTDVVTLEEGAIATGVPPNNSDAYTINGRPGNLYTCSNDMMFTLNVVKGKLYLLRIINAAMNIPFFFKISHHKLTVVAADAVYTDPYVTDVITIAPGQTIDALLHANQSPSSSYYMAAHPYASAPAVPFPNTTTRGVIHYGSAWKTKRSKKRVLMPKLPLFFDTPTAHKFYTNLTALVNGPHWVPVPKHVDEKMFITMGLALEACADNATCPKFSASMNNHSFVLPKTMSILEAVYKGVEGIYTPDFPNQPPVKFDYTNPNITQINPSLLFAKKSTSTKVLKFNSTVDVVLQNHALLAAENHPMHLHGFNFHVLAQGFGNYNPIRDTSKFNLVNPQFRNTLAVPVGGWAVIRFTADNPGAWIMHCHIDVHLPFGLGMVFVVKNGPTKETSLPIPPADLPKC